MINIINYHQTYLINKNIINKNIQKVKKIKKINKIKINKIFFMKINNRKNNIIKNNFQNYYRHHLLINLIYLILVIMNIKLHIYFLLLNSIVKKEFKIKLYVIAIIILKSHIIKLTDIIKYKILLNIYINMFIYKNKIRINHNKNLYNIKYYSYILWMILFNNIIL